MHPFETYRKSFTPTMKKRVLADILGMTSSMVGHIESGRRGVRPAVARRCVKAVKELGIGNRFTFNDLVPAIVSEEVDESA